MPVFVLLIAPLTATSPSPATMILESCRSMSESIVRVSPAMAAPMPIWPRLTVAAVMGELAATCCCRSDDQVTGWPAAPVPSSVRASPLMLMPP